MSDTVHDLDSRPVHLGRGATAETEPEFTGRPDWYVGYAARHEADGTEGRLVTQHSFADPWDTWEMHPNGHEVVVCLDGTITLFQETASGVVEVTLTTGQYIVNPPGVWHTADVSAPATALFITAGQGTEVRPR